MLVEQRAFAIGDIHGCNRTFRKMVEDIIQLNKTDQLFLLGDYVDRGPDSKGVIDFILNLREQGFQIHTIRGNHDEMMMNSNQNFSSYMHWIENGGSDTMDSFSVRTYDQIDSKYKTFFYNTQLYIEFEKYILVHAGLNFKTGDPFEDTHSMMWIRGFKIDEPWLGDRVIVHGHTPIPFDVIKTQAGGKVINLDGGCVYKKITGMGNLVALELRAQKFIAVENCE